MDAKYIIYLVCLQLFLENESNYFFLLFGPKTDVIGPRDGINVYPSCFHQLKTSTSTDELVMDTLFNFNSLTERQLPYLFVYQLHLTIISKIYYNRKKMEIEIFDEYPPLRSPSVRKSKHFWDYISLGLYGSLAPSTGSQATCPSV